MSAFRPRSIITRAVVFLLLGAILNVAVAWVIGAGFSGDGTRTECKLESSTDHPSRLASIAVARERTAPATRLEFFTSFQADGDWQYVSDLTAEVPNWAERHLHQQELTKSHLGHQVIVHATGWPVPSMSGCIDLQWISSISQSIDPDWAIVLPPPKFWRTDRSRIIPLRPIALGFAINTLFYTAILWLLFAAPFALQRRIRRKRNLCPACAYPVGVSPVCTECGKPVTPRAPGVPN